MQSKKDFKIVHEKKTRMILPNAITLIGVCIGLTSIKLRFLSTIMIPTPVL